MASPPGKNAAGYAMKMSFLKPPRRGKNADKLGIRGIAAEAAAKAEAAAAAAAWPIMGAPPRFIANEPAAIGLGRNAEIVGFINEWNLSRANVPDAQRGTNIKHVADSRLVYIPTDDLANFHSAIESILRQPGFCTGLTSKYVYYAASMADGVFKLSNRDNTELYGFALVKKYDPYTWEIDVICSNSVNPREYSNIGRMLIVAINAAAHRVGIRRLILKSVPAAKDFYIKLNFVETGNVDAAGLIEMVKNVAVHGGYARRRKTRSSKKHSIRRYTRRR